MKLQPIALIAKLADTFLKLLNRNSHGDYGGSYFDKAAERNASHLL
jgi:hypothetical protein